MEKIWQACSAQLEMELPPKQFDLWIKPLVLLGIEGQVFRVAAPNQFKLNMAKREYGSRITSLLSQQMNDEVDVQFTLQPKKAAAIPVPEKPADDAGAADVEVPEPPVNGAENQAVSRSLNSEWTFDSFVTGQANQLARAAAVQVANNPGSSYNPLFVYGGVGLGKTHLIHAIGNQVLMDQPSANVRYVRADHYVTDVVSAYQRQGFDDFKRDYHSLDMLLIDDIQLIGGNKTRTQEEFFYVFETLIAANKQIIITCDTYPKEITGIDSRLTSRFASGLTVAIEPPELEMRVAILQKKAGKQGRNLSDEVAFFMAKHVRSNVRELEGALRNVIAYSNFQDKDITVGVARDALKDLLSVQNRQISVENIQKTVAEFFKIKLSDMYSKSRQAKVVRPRHVAMYLAKELTQKSLPEIGAKFDGRDHTTVLHAVRKIAKERQHDPELNHALHVLEQTLKD